MPARLRGSAYNLAALPRTFFNAIKACSIIWPYSGSAEAKLAMARCCRRQHERKWYQSQICLGKLPKDEWININFIQRSDVHHQSDSCQEIRCSDMNARRTWMNSCALITWPAIFDAKRWRSSGSSTSRQKFPACVKLSSSAELYLKSMFEGQIWVKLFRSKSLYECVHFFFLSVNSL